MRSWRRIVVLATLLVMIVPQLALATVSPGMEEQNPVSGRIGENNFQGDAVFGHHLFDPTGRARSFGSLFYYQMLALARWVSWLSGWTR
jgi:hypothetical protein